MALAVYEVRATPGQTECTCAVKWFGTVSITGHVIPVLSLALCKGHPKSGSLASWKGIREHMDGNVPQSSI